MAVFSRRNGYNTAAMQLECASDTLKRRIMAAFYAQEFNTDETLDWITNITGIENVMIEMGVLFESPEIILSNNVMQNPCRERLLNQQNGIPYLISLNVILLFPVKALQ